MSSPFYRSKFHSPKIFLSEIVRKGAQGQYLERGDNPAFLYRAIVYAVDVRGGQLENPGATGQVTHSVGGKDVSFKAISGPENPRNSIRARIITEGFDQFIHDENLRTFWPLFPEHDAVPVKPGEHVYVIFEDERFEHGLWVSKCPGHENVNFYPGQDSFDTTDGSLANLYPQGQGAGAQENRLSTDTAAAESRPDGELPKLFT